MSAKGDSNGWDRVNFNVRLTKARRQQLKTLAASLADGATPVDALDRALALALQPKTGQVDDQRMDDLEDLIAAHDMKTEFEFGQIGEGLGRVNKALGDLRALISTFSEQEDDARPVPDSQAPLPFRAWIAREMAARHIKGTREAMVRLSWRSMAAPNARIADIDFDATLISVDGKPARVAAAGLVGVRFSVDPKSEFAGCWRRGPMALRCQARAEGWKIDVHSLRDDGGAGELIAKLGA